MRLQSLPIAGLFASTGAPVVYVAYILFDALSRGHRIDGVLLATIVVTSALFSLLVTEAFVIVTLAIAWTFRLQNVNVAAFAIGYLFIFAALIGSVYGARDLMFWMLFSTPNVLLLIWFATRA